MSQELDKEISAAFFDSAAIITAYASGDNKAYVNMLVHMDDMEKMALIGALIHLIVHPENES